MKVGELNKRITFQENHSISKSSGHVDNWTDVATVWASIQPLQGREYWQAQQVNSEITVKIKIRYNKLLDNPKLRAIYKNTIYNLEVPINTNMANVELIFMAKVNSNEQ